mmetsp:Transcript_16053/g.39554  ORF Transcript_16053/g.39554 Transcript_16053/m.39554 type:complete len:853 (-) Transcript_16053:222-2780(-)
MRLLANLIFVAHLVYGTDIQSPSDVTPTDHGVKFRVGARDVELAVEGESAFRLSIGARGSTSNSRTTMQIPDPMIAEQESFAKFDYCVKDYVVTLQTAFGSMSIDTSTSGFTLRDSKGDEISATPALFSDQGGCNVSLAGYDVQDGERTSKNPFGTTSSSEEECCEACQADDECDVWIYALGNQKDVNSSDSANCWTMKAVTAFKPAQNRAVGGPHLPPSSPMAIRLGGKSDAKFYGTGAGGSTARTLLRTGSSPHVVNTEFFIPSYWTTDGYRALGVSSLNYSAECLYAYPASWNKGDDGSVSWSIAAPQGLDIYLMPAESMKDGISALWELTGRPALPPRYAFGFHASRWGWKNAQYIDHILNEFRNGSFPIDSWISDFEWFAIHPDYLLPEEGESDYMDFGYNNVTFPDPVAQLKHYHEDLHVRFGGIRKPRLGNKDLLVMARSKNWTVNAPHGGGAPGASRNLNYTIPAVREWYYQHQAHYLKDGVDYFWNDEGESYYFAFHHWNQAEFDGNNIYLNNTRFWSINRAFTVGMQRMGAITWTGDQPVSWDALGNHPGYVLNWGLAGSHIVTCDTGGFSGADTPVLLLVRWYQYASLMPIMRVHSTLEDLPHFPFLYGEEAGNAMRKALELRYRLLPYHYSLAHAAYLKGGSPMMRPLAFEFSEDANVDDMTYPWLDGEGILCAPVLSQDNSTQVYLPGTAETQWFQWNSTRTISGGQTLTLSSVPLDFTPIYAKAGAVIPLGPVVQYSEYAHGSPLNVHVYAGASGSFSLFEDDGMGKEYMSGAGRVTTFTWDNDAKLLSWSVDGAIDASLVPFAFEEVTATVFFPGESEAVSKGPVPLGDKGNKIPFN